MNLNHPPQCSRQLWEPARAMGLRWACLCAHAAVGGGGQVDHVVTTWRHGRVRRKWLWRLAFSRRRTGRPRRRVRRRVRAGVRASGCVWVRTPTPARDANTWSHGHLKGKSIYGNKLRRTRLMVTGGRHGRSGSMGMMNGTN